MASNSSEFLELNSFTPVMPIGPAASYGSPPLGQEDSSGSSSKGGVSVGGLDQNMIKWLYEKGLPSDTEQFLSEMDMAISTAFNPVTGKPNLASYKLLLPKLAQLRQERDEFDSAVNKMKEMGSYSEAAVNLQGEVYVIDAVNKTITTKNIDDISEEDRILTNGELAELRMNNRNAAFKSEYSFTIANGTSMQKVTDYLMSMISKIGSTSQEAQTFQNADGKVIQGAKILQEMISKGSTGLLETDISTKESLQQAKYTLTYILQHLPKESNMTALIRLRAKQAGVTPVEFISNLVNAQISNSTKTDQTIHAAKDGDGNSVTGTSTDKIPADPVVLFALGKTPAQEYMLNDISGSSATYFGKAHIGTLAGQKQFDLLTEVQKGKFGSILDWNNVTMDSQRVENLAGVQLRDNKIISLELPLDPNSNTIQPDLRSLPYIDVVEKQIKNDQVDPRDIKTINAYYEHGGLPPKYKEDGSLNVEYRRFAVISAYADENALGQSVDGGSHIKVENKPLQETIVRNFAIWRNSTNLNKVEEDELVTGKIFIPIISEQNGYESAILAAYQSNGIDLNIGQASDLATKEGENVKKQEYGYHYNGNFNSISK